MGEDEATEVENVLQALEELERLSNIRPPFGAASLPPHVRFRLILERIRDIVCPALKRIAPSLDSTEADLSTIITDALLSVYFGVLLPVTTIASRIAKIGHERFCRQPHSLVDHDA
jgi:hypothetical protein